MRVWAAVMVVWAGSASAAGPCCSGLEQCLERLADTSSPEPEPDSRPLRRDCESTAVVAFGKQAVPRLIALLASDDWRVRDGAAEALGQLEATEAVPALLALNERDPNSWAGWALEAIGDERAVPALIRRMLDGRGAAEQFPEALLAKAVPLAIDALGAPQPDAARLDAMVELIERTNGGRPSNVDGTRRKSVLRDEDAKRLHALLVRALDAGQGPLPPAGPTECTDSTPDGFALDVGPCLPRAGQLVLALASFGGRAAFAGKDIDRAAERGPALMTQAAHRAGLAVGSPATLARLRADLASGDAARVRSAAFGSLDLPSEDGAIRSALGTLVKSLSSRHCLPSRSRGASNPTGRWSS